LSAPHIGSIEGGTGSYSGAIVSGAGFVQAGRHIFDHCRWRRSKAETVITPGYIEIGGRLGKFTAAR
jgi:hypothetical protein